MLPLMLVVLQPDIFTRRLSPTCSFCWRTQEHSNMEMLWCNMNSQFQWFLISYGKRLNADKTCFILFFSTMSEWMDILQRCLLLIDHWIPPMGQSWGTLFGAQRRSAAVRDVVGRQLSRAQFGELEWSKRLAWRKFSVQHWIWDHYVWQLQQLVWWKSTSS